jgi:hypothetical protein
MEADQDHIIKRYRNKIRKMKTSMKAWKREVVETTSTSSLQHKDS